MMRRVLLVLGVGAVTMAAAITYGGNPTPEAEAQGQIEGCSVIFNFSGTSIDFNVPDGVERVELDIYGAAGGDATGPASRTTSARAGSGPGCRMRSSG